MKISINIAIVWLMLGIGDIQAAILHPLNELRPIEAAISKSDLTRITVKNDRIKGVFGVADAYSLEADEGQGQIFIRPLQDKPLHLTITTEGGQTQDLRLIPQDTPAETLILTKIAPVKGTRGSLSRTEVEELLKACQHNRIPVGYRQVPVIVNTLKQPYLLVREIRNDHLRGLTFEVKDTVSLSAEEFAKTCNLPLHDIVVIVMPTKPFTGGLVYVVARAHS